MSGAAHRFKHLLRIRLIEQRIEALYPEQKIRCPTYFSTGQEAVAVGVAAALERDDVSFAAHRNHAHYLAKGGSLPAMLAELYGKVGGCAGGRGGSLHLIDTDAGFRGSTPIVGSTIPIAVGWAFANRLRDRRAVAAVFFGDGATESGVFHESLNFAAVHRLAVLFVCENNLYSIYSPLGPRQPAGRSIAAVARAAGLCAGEVDGQDVECVYAAARSAVDRLRAGDGPVLLECATYRFVQHVGPGGDEHLPYRSKAEIDAWKARDPIVVASARFDADAGSEADLAAWRATVEEEIDDALRFARESPVPDRSELMQHIYDGERA